MPSNYPNAGATIPPSKRTYSKILQATNDVHKTAYKAAIITMGGVVAVASMIYSAMNAFALVGQELSFELQAIMTRINQATQLKSGSLYQFNAVLAILSRLV
jgi:hypothetical protein